MQVNCDRIVVVLFLLVIVVIINAQNELSDHEFVTNLDDRCLQCLCQAATGCNLTRTCEGHYCGPFKVSKVYWVDTGRVVQHPDDNPLRANAFEDCAFQYDCASRMVKNYMSKFGRDCNNDGVTDCNDFLMLHYNGGFQCQQALDREENGEKWLVRFQDCYDL